MAAVETAGWPAGRRGLALQIPAAAFDNPPPALHYTRVPTASPDAPR
jgi:hypothetical protein